MKRFSQLSLLRGDKTEERNVSAIQLLVETFRCLDDDIISCWSGGCGTNNDKPACNRLSPERLLTLLQKIPRPHHRDWKLICEGRTAGSATPGSKLGVPFDIDGNEQGDVLLTCLWVSNRLWHLALLHGCLSSDNSYAELRPDFAIEIARETLLICKSFSMSSLEMHRTGLVSKPTILEQ